MQQLIPYVDEEGSKNDDRAGPPRFASEERREIAEVNKVSYQSVHFIFQSPDEKLLGSEEFWNCVVFSVAD